MPQVFWLETGGLALGLFELFALAVALGVDALSVSVGLGVGGPSRRRIVQIGAVFAVASAALVTGGYLLARMFHGAFVWLAMLADKVNFSLQRVSPEVLSEQLHVLLSLLGATILAGIGLHWMWMWWRGGEPWTLQQPMSVRGVWGLISLAMLVSIDTLTAGIGLGMLRHGEAMEAALVVGAVNGGMCMTGLGLGRTLDRHVRGRLHPVGGMLLIAVALRFLYALF